MPTATYHLIDGHSVRRTEQGDEIIEVAEARGFSAFVGYAKLQAAMNPQNYSAVNRPPVIGEAHPSRPTATLREIIPEALSSDDVKLTFIYRDYFYEIPTITISSNASEVETNRGYRAGLNQSISNTLEDFSLYYQYPADYKENPNLAGEEKRVGALATMLTPEPTVTVTQKVTNNGSFILYLNSLYVGTVNAGGFVMGENTYTEAHWLCTDIQANSTDTVTNWTTDSSRVYTVTISFAYRQDKWLKEVVFIDGQTGKPPDDLVDGRNNNIEDAGIKTYMLYDNRNFNELLTSFTPQIIL
jgi:hypothetical protein